jgi:hypothetical protein
MFTCLLLLFLPWQKSGAASCHPPAPCPSKQNPALVRLLFRPPHQPRPRTSTLERTALSLAIKSMGPACVLVVEGGGAMERESVPAHLSRRVADRWCAHGVQTFAQAASRRTPRVARGPALPADCCVHGGAHHEQAGRGRREGARRQRGPGWACTASRRKLKSSANDRSRCARARGVHARGAPPTTPPHLDGLGKGQARDGEEDGAHGCWV